jgi:saccharopine dehydrogenase-like NADP-dependent oxidoreductase
MRNILILGAGKSSIALIDYLVKHARKEKWQVTVADITAELALQKTKGRANTKAIGFNLQKQKERRALISEVDIVISMLPASLHLVVAKDCIKLRKNLVTPSYISDAMREMNAEVEKNGLIFMNEMGLDPGIDHMSSMQLIDKLKATGNTIIGYESHCGGLVAPESDDNLWHYKFTWNPRNVILAGQGDGAIQYLNNGKKVKLKYENLFKEPTKIDVKGNGKFESYPNRDSLKYVQEYGLKGVKTMYRGTLRKPPFCKGWNMFVQLGYTNNVELDYNLFVKKHNKLISSSAVITDRNAEDLLSTTTVLSAFLTHKGSTIIPAKLLQQVLEERWVMKPKDKDMVVMVHQITYKDKANKQKKLQSSLVYVGKNAEHTAMATTVGLPVAMVTKMILNGEIKRRGVLMPKYPEIYNPILAELQDYGIKFKETTK